MAESLADQSRRNTPITMRWVESLSRGNLRWYLAALEPDGQFWGYVHIRTNELNENRSFVGQIDELKHQQIRDAINGIVPNNINKTDGEFYDGLLGLGTRAEFTTLIRFRSGPNRLPDSDTFIEIVSILLPELRLASDLSVD